MSQDFDPRNFLIIIFCFIVAITAHEFGHAYSADLLGDETPRKQGRVTLNPIDHLDPIGTIFLVATALYNNGFTFGWGKPVQINPSRFKNPRTGDLIVTFAGPLMNLLLAAIVMPLLIRNTLHLPEDSPYFDVMDRFVMLNLALFLFNLIPVPPLDGSHILAALLPDPLATRYRNMMSRFGMWFLMGVLILVGYIIAAPLDALSSFLAKASGG